MTEPVQETAQQPDTETDTDASDSLGDAGKRALAAERRLKTIAENRAKDLERQLQEIRDRDLSDLDRARRSADEAAQEAAQARAEATRYRIATKFGISDEDALLLTGSEDDMTAAARRLKALYEAASASVPAGPRPDLSQGARTEAMALNGDPLVQSLIAKVGARSR